VDGTDYLYFSFDSLVIPSLGFFLMKIQTHISHLTWGVYMGEALEEVFISWAGKMGCV
jgi:hypothetical protein